MPAEQTQHIISMILDEQTSYEMMQKMTNNSTFVMSIGSMNATKSSYIGVTDNEDGDDTEENGDDFLKEIESKHHDTNTRIPQGPM